MSLYADLGVPKDADGDAIKRAYRKKASEHHPDREGGDKGKFQVIQRAYDTLSDAEKRKRYDETGSTDEPHSLENVARQNLAGLIYASIERMETGDIVTAIIESVHKGIDQAKNFRKEIEGKIKKFERAAKRFRHKKGKENLIVMMIEAQIAAEKTRLEAADHDVAVGKKIIEILRDYEYDAPKAGQLSGVDQLRQALAAKQPRW